MVIPVAKSKIQVRIDDIPFKINIFIVPDDQLAKEILIGRNILLKTGTKAIMDFSGVSFALDDSIKRDECLEVEMTDMDQVKPVEEIDVQCEGFDEESKIRLLTLLNKYRRNIAFNIR